MIPLVPTTMIQKVSSAILGLPPSNFMIEEPLHGIVDVPPLVDHLYFSCFIAGSIVCSSFPTGLIGSSL